MDKQTPDALRVMCLLMENEGIVLPRADRVANTYDCRGCGAMEYNEFGPTRGTADIDNHASDCPVAEILHILEQYR